MSIHTASDVSGKFPSALCAQSDPELFFPEKGGNGGLIAKKICARCIHSQGENECLEDALSQPPSFFGIRGGKSKRERRAILKAQNRKGKML